MNNTTDNLADLWLESRTSFTNLLETVTENDLPKKMHPSPNSIGFLIRHIGDVELLFAKNVFHLDDPTLVVHAKTVILKTDTGEWTDLASLKEYTSYSGDVLKLAIEQVKDDDWTTFVTTKEFGTKTLAEAMGRIISHTAYHAGQLGMAIKYGKHGIDTLI